MKKKTEEKKSFITNVREMSTQEKVLLGTESACYVLTLVCLGSTCAGLFGVAEVGSVFALGLDAVTFAITGQVFRKSRDTQKRMNSIRKNQEENKKIVLDDYSNQKGNERTFRK